MSWFRVEADMPDHPKVRRLARVLGISRREAVGLVTMLWCQVCRFAPDGALVDYSADDVEDLAGWDGEQGALVEALRRAELVDETDEGLVVHGWMERAESFKKAQAKARQRADRDKGTTVARRSRDKATTVAPDGTGRDGTGRERTKDLRPGGSATRAPAPPPPGDGPPPPVDDDRPSLVLEPSECEPAPDVVVEVPCKGRQGRPYAVTRAELDAWAKAYPGVNVEAQVRKAAGWAANRPAKQKAHRNIPRWLCDVWFAPELGKAPAPARGGGRQLDLETRNRAVLDAWEREQAQSATGPPPVAEPGDGDASGWVEAEDDERGAQAPERRATG